MIINAVVNKIGLLYCLVVYKDFQLTNGRNPQYIIRINTAGDAYEYSLINVIALGHASMIR